MNGIKHDHPSQSLSSGSGAIPPPTPPKQSSNLHGSVLSTASSLTEKALPPIQARKYLRASTKVPASERSSVAVEYQSLISRIKSTGLKVTSRDGAKRSGQILIFVKADDRLLTKLARQEALSDYLHGVLSIEPPPPRSSSLEAENKTKNSSASPLHLTPASRLRLVDSLLTLPNLTSDAVKDASGGKSQVPSGAGLRIGNKEFPHLVDMSAIHDPAYNSSWMKRWAHTSPFKAFTGVGLDDLDSIREHFGEDVALYFGFLNYYFQALAPAAALGVLLWLLGRPFSPVYSFGLVIWSCLFVELWRMKERKLAVRWGTLGVSQVDRRRHDFVPRATRIDPATEEPEEVFEWWRRELRVILSLPIVALFASILAATVTLMFVIEIFVTQLYHGPLKMAVPFIPTALLVVAVPQIMAAWQATAVAITKWENHHSAKSYDHSLTLKRFAMQAITAYGALTLSAYVYIPFGENIMQTMVAQGWFKDSIKEAVRQGKIGEKGIDFHINPDRMHTQLFAVSVTSQFVNAFTELALPVILRKVGEWREERAEKKNSSTSSSSSGGSGASPIRQGSADSASSSGTITPVESDGSESERSFLHRVRRELALPPYDLFGDYAEMATQFGYITLWSSVWPLSPVMGFLNNFFELRSDAAKISLNNRRPVPVRAETIGPWLEAFGFIAWLSALNNAALVYLFQQSETAGVNGHSAYETTMRTHLHPRASAGNMTVKGMVDAQSVWSFSRLLPQNIPTSGAAGAIVAAVLVALLAEHVYGLVRSGVRHVLERLIWRGSSEEMVVRRREWILRVETLKLHVAAQDEREIKQKVDVGADQERAFWDEDKDVGLDAIRTSGKTE
uniref:Related to IST2-Plasma membrane protein that may be involved in osmotolerance n=1 Tax=Melanopsichium pennsylvanicum 4 TaxID=1398559 RepID=A0A077QYR6_9BASI|nr:related to IST2-Plasma membrane protein that may be involved in osmotolerance [Melanopsichium pennsylvanicum 4]